MIIKLHDQKMQDFMNIGWELTEKSAKIFHHGNVNNTVY